jgi:hypothetical protein
MNQLAINFTRPCEISPQIPTAGQTQLLILLAALQRGERLTVGYALTQYGVYALSQRLGDLRRMGWPIQSRNVKNGNGWFHAEYFL